MGINDDYDDDFKLRKPFGLQGLYTNMSALKQLLFDTSTPIALRYSI